MGGYDTQDPSWVAAVIIEQLEIHWATHPPNKPILLVTQETRHEEKGISAITRAISFNLAIQRLLIFLDAENIADYHSKHADRYKVISEIPYSALTHKFTGTTA